MEGDESPAADGDRVQKSNLLSPEETASARHRAGAHVVRTPTGFVVQPYLFRLRGREFGWPWMSVAASMCTMICLGGWFSWGALSPHVSAPGFLRNAPATQTIWVGASLGVVMPIATLAAPMLHKLIGVTATTAIGGIIAGVGLMTCSVATSLPALIFTFGVLMGSGIGIAFITCIVSAQQWYPSRRGTIGGLVLASIGGSGFVFNMLVGMLANPNGVPTRPTEGEDPVAWAEMYHAEMAKHVPTTFLVMGSITLVLGTLCSLFVHVPRKAEPPLEEPAASGGDRDVELAAVTDAHGAPAAPDDSPASVAVNFSPRQMLRTPQCWMIFISLLFVVSAGSLLISQYGEFATRHGEFTVRFAIVGAVAALANAAGRVLWGALADLLDYRRAYVIALSLLALIFFAYFETRKNVVAFGAVTCLFYFCYGGVGALLPTAIADAFGTQHHARNYSIVFSGLSLAPLPQALLLSTLLEALGSYRYLFYICGSMTVVSTLLMVAYKPPGRGRWFAIWLSYRRK